MTNIPLPQSFEDLKTYQDQYNSNYTIFTNEYNKQLNTISKQQIFKGVSPAVQSDWIPMQICSNQFWVVPSQANTIISSSTPQTPFTPPTGISAVFAEYEVQINNITGNIIPTITAKIFITSSPDGTSQGPTRPLSNFSEVSTSQIYQILQTNEDGTINLLVVSGLMMEVSNFPPYIPGTETYQDSFPEGYGPLPTYYSKLMFSFANTRIYT